MIWLALIACLIVQITGGIITEWWYITPIASGLAIFLIMGDLGDWSLQTFINQLSTRLSSSKSNPGYVTYAVFAKVLFGIMSITLALYAHLSYRIDAILLALAALKK